MRTRKHILVSVRYEGKLHYRLMSARLVSKRWEVDAIEFHKWLFNEIGVRERATITT